MATYYGSQAPRRTIDQSKTNTSKHTADDNSMNVYGKNDSGMKDNADNPDLSNFSSNAPDFKEILHFTPNNIVRGIVYSEILGKPKGFKGFRY